MTRWHLGVLLGLAALAWGPIGAQESYYLLPGRAEADLGFGCPAGLLDWVREAVGEWDVVCSVIPPFLVSPYGDHRYQHPLMIVQPGVYPYAIVRSRGTHELRLAVKLPMSTRPEDADLSLVVEATGETVQLAAPEAILALHDEDTPGTYVAFDVPLDAIQMATLPELAGGGEVRASIAGRKPVKQRLSKRNLSTIARMLDLWRAILDQAAR